MGASPLVAMAVPALRMPLEISFPMAEWTDALSITEAEKNVPRGERKATFVALLEIMSTT